MRNKYLYGHENKLIIFFLKILYYANRMRSANKNLPYGINQHNLTAF